METEKKSGIKLSADWLAVICGSSLMVLIYGGVLTTDIVPWKMEWLQTDWIWFIVVGSAIFAMVYAGVLKKYGEMETSGVPTFQEKATNFVTGLILLISIVFMSWGLDRLSERLLGKGLYLTYILWAILIGMLIRNLFFRERIPKRLETILGTYEFFIKTGLVLLGAKLSFWFIAAAGIRGLAFAFTCMPVAIFLIMYFGKKLNLSLKFRAVMATAIAVCGVSAALATAGAIGADRKHTAYIITILMLIGLPTLFVYPAIGYAFGIPPRVYGAWAGGSIDNTATAVAAGYAYAPDFAPELAGDVATITKYVYNALIGVIAFIWAVYFARREAIEKEQKVSAKIIWDKFPKFILGFLAMAIVFTLFNYQNGIIGNWITKGMVDTSKSLYHWLFALTFAGVGLESGVKELRTVGGSPVYLFALSTIILAVLAYIVAFVVWMPF